MVHGRRNGPLDQRTKNPYNGPMQDYGMWKKQLTKDQNIQYLKKKNVVNFRKTYFNNNRCLAMLLPPYQRETVE